MPYLCNFAAFNYKYENQIDPYCAADLKRMTGYVSTNSLSHFAVVRNSSDYYQRYLITEQEDGKRGLIFVTLISGNTLKVEVKGE